MVQGGTHAHHAVNCWPQTVERIGNIQNEAGGDGVTLVKTAFTRGNAVCKTVIFPPKSVFFVYYVITLCALRNIYAQIGDVVHEKGENNGKKCHEEGGMLLIFSVLVT